MHCRIICPTGITTFLRKPQTEPCSAFAAGKIACRKGCTGRLGRSLGCGLLLCSQWWMDYMIQSMQHTIKHNGCDIPNPVLRLILILYLTIVLWNMKALIKWIQTYPICNITSGPLVDLLCGKNCPLPNERQAINSHHKDSTVTMVPKKSYATIFVSEDFVKCLSFKSCIPSSPIDLRFRRQYCCLYGCRLLQRSSNKPQ